MSEEKNTWTLAAEETQAQEERIQAETLVEAAREGRLRFSFKVFPNSDPDARLKSDKQQLEKIREEVSKIRNAYPWNEEKHGMLLERAIATAQAAGIPTHEHGEGDFYNIADAIPDVKPTDKKIIEVFAHSIYTMAHNDVNLIQQLKGELLRAYDDDPPTYTLTAQGELFPLTIADLPMMPPILRRATVLCARRTLERAWEVFPQLLGLIDRALKPQISKASRTRAEARGHFLTPMCNRLPLPTRAQYRGALNTKPHDNAYILSEMFSDPKIFLERGQYWVQQSQDKKIKRALDITDLNGLKATGEVTDEDITSIAQVYTLIVKARESGNLNAEIHVYMHDFLKAMGIENGGSNSIRAILQRFQRLNNVFCFFDRGIYAALLLKSYNDDNSQVIILESPYLDKIYSALANIAIRRDKKGQIVTIKETGTPKTLAAHSYLAHSELASQRNKKAVRLVFELIQFIESAGPCGTPRMSWRTWIQKIPGLEDEILKGYNPSLQLKRLFTAVWAYAIEHTDLFKKYPDLVLPMKKYPEKGRLDEIITLRDGSKNAEAVKEEKRRRAIARNKAKKVKEKVVKSGSL